MGRTARRARAHTDAQSQAHSHAQPDANKQEQATRRAVTYARAAELGAERLGERAHLAHAALIGRIPTQLGNLVELNRLLLQTNFLTGPLPSQ